MGGAAVLQHHIGKGSGGPLSHVVITVMGRFKVETGIRHHLQAVVKKTSSKVKVKWWL